MLCPECGERMTGSYDGGEANDYALVVPKCNWCGYVDWDQAELDDDTDRVKEETRMYQVGRAEHPIGSDPRYDTETEALEAAKRAALGDYVVAVWQWFENESDTLYLIYQGDVWRR